MNADAPARIIAVAGWASPGEGHAGVTGPASAFAYLSVAADAAPIAAAATTTVSGGASLLAGVRGLSIWSRLSSLFDGAGSVDTPTVAEPLLKGSLLSLVPSAGTRLNSNSRAWEITAGVCLGVALAGYWYSSATPVEEKTQSARSARLRRFRDGWELTPLHER